MNVQRKVLKNGVKAVVVETDSELVSVNVTIGAGGRYENPENFGISHFLEHMVFKGTKKYPSSKIFAEVIESIGGSQNAWTSEEYTSYWCRVPKNYALLCLDTLFEQVANPLLEEAEINKERGVILSEINRNKDRPDEYLWSRANEIFWPKQSISSDLLGPIKNIKRFKQKDFLDYLNNYYVGNNMSVSLAGGIKSKEAFELLEKTFGRVKPGKKISPDPIVETQKNKAEKVIERAGSEQAHIAIGFKAFSYRDKKKDALNVLMTMLGEGMSSILFREIREKRGLAYTVWAGSSLFSDAGIAAFYAAVEPKNAKQTIEVITKELETIKAGRFSDSELRRAKEYLKGRYLANFEGTSKLSAWYGTRELLSPELLDLKQLPQIIEEVTREEVTRVAKELFVPEKENVIVLGPFKKTEKFSRI